MLRQSLLFLMLIFTATTVTPKTIFDRWQKDPSHKQITCLATNIYFESRNQPLVGMIAVAQVVMNRVESDKFPDTICEVVYQSKMEMNDKGKWKPILNKCQFSWFCDGKPDLIVDRSSWSKSRKLAKQIYESQMIDITEGSLYYHNHKVNPKWSKYMTKTVTINHHTFYRG